MSGRSTLSGKTMEQLRAEYEHAVQTIAQKVLAMRKGGSAPEAVARLAHAERQRIALTYKDLTPEPLRSQILQRTISVYGQTAGPTTEYLRKQGKSWEQIADGAARPGRDTALLVLRNAGRPDDRSS
jgi:hypothetical protein